MPKSKKNQPKNISLSDNLLQEGCSYSHRGLFEKGTRELKRSFTFKDFLDYALIEMLGRNRDVQGFSKEDIENLKKNLLENNEFDDSEIELFTGYLNKYGLDVCMYLTKLLPDELDDNLIRKFIPKAVFLSNSNPYKKQYSKVTNE